MNAGGVLVRLGQNRYRRDAWDVGRVNDVEEMLSAQYLGRYGHGCVVS